MSAAGRPRSGSVTGPGAAGAAGREASAPLTASWLTRLSGPLLTAGVTLLAGAAVTVVNPDQPGHFPVCPFRALTGLDCPFCGGLRGVHDLTHGQVVAALDQNALVVLAVPLAVLGWLRWVHRSARGTPARPAPGWVLPAALAVVLAFWVVRNLPGVPFLHSGIG